jgi:putative membrane protein
VYRWTFAVFLAILAASWWRPIYPADQALHHSLTAVALVGLELVMRRRPLPYASFCLILIFLTLHTIAARWIYSFVPYDDWTQSLFGFRLDDVLGSDRNNFDRLVHFSYGACLGPVLFRFLRAERGWRTRWAALVSVDVILSTSAFYELFEWVIAMSLAPGAAEAYNGQQGDIWDAQKDMATATAGAILAVALVAWAGHRNRIGSGSETESIAG